MRALVCNTYGPPDTLKIEHRPDPECGPNKIMIDVAAAGINFPDVLSIAGKYQVKTPTPFVPGNEACGTVVAIGSAVTDFAPGDKVIVTTRGNAFAEKCVADEKLSMPLPDGLSFEQGAGFAVTYGTSYHALKQRAALQPGETVLVLGAAGGVGIAAVEIAKAMGARVIAAASTAERLEFALAAGADDTINYADQPLNDAVKALTDRRGVDVVCDPVGGDLAIPALRATAWHGRYLVIGFASGDIPALPANLALLKEASIMGVWWGTWVANHPAEQTQNMQEMAALIDTGRLKPRITESHPIEDFAKAFDAISTRRAQGKVILKMI